MIISTFNIQNDFKKYKKDKSKIIYNYLKDNNIDIIGLQEVYYMLNHSLNKLLKHSYMMKGKYRFFLKLIHLTSNEKTPIISKYKIISHKTYSLPFRPSLLKRVLTHVIVEYENKQISVYNTHLESELNHVKKKQLDKILDVIQKDNLPKIIFGDFNLKDDNPIFQEFIGNLEKLDITRLPINEATYKFAKSNKAIDHVFYSNDFVVNSYEVIKNINTSDHYPIIVDLDLKK